MNDFPRWKYWLVALVILAGLIYSLPNIFLQEPAVQVSANRGATIDDALREQVQGVLETAKLPFDSIKIEGERLMVRVETLDLQNKAADTIKSAFAEKGEGDKYVVALNLASTVPGWLRAIGANAMPLGLDLQGGVSFLMQVDQKSVLEAQELRYVGDIQSTLREKGIRAKSVSRGTQGLIAQLRSEEDRAAAFSAISAATAELELENGPVVGDSYTLIARIKRERLVAIAQNTIKQNVATLRNRINAIGVAEPVIQQQGDSRIVVELPGLQDTTEAKKILGATATLEYRAVDENTNAMEAQRTGQVPPDARLYRHRDGTPIVLKKRVIVTGDELVDASSAPDPQTGEPSVSITLNAAGGRKMLDFTRENVGRRMATVYIERIPETKIVDGKEVTVPKITEEVINAATIRGVFSNKFQTTGIGSMKEASDLALFLRAGSLAAPVDIVEERVIGPSLGQDNIRTAIRAVLISLLLVVIFVAIYYKLFGLIADFALLLNLVLLVAILSLFQATLTLPGIAGIVLTLGMAIDANVLICERIREEVRNGSTPLAAIRAGYDKAWATILDANVTHLIAAFGLMAFGSGPLRGFAITLAIGILTSMFTAVTVTRALVQGTLGGRKLKTLSV
ncbi:MAG TPA: protein translocase subunit SecD [Dokdonella sp.]|uniref:protein translocase subunit SecD n=1 Tax=Dokdonella sp. TaxID=2291710 RepID=UPI002C327B50|nr:protein translocase subunit SecD [Dokdonella sp.]HUD42564.1 protein translocase subunit SecD [Dokdonella sp.]